MSMILYSPMESFNIFNLFSVTLSINNVVFYLLIGALISPLLQFVGTLKGSIVPNGWGIIGETLFSTILSLVKNSTGKTTYFPLIYTLFYLILFSNLIGMVPYSSTPTVEFVITLTLSITLLIGVLVLGVFTHNILLAAAFLPAGTPLPLTALLIIIEVIAYTTRTLSLGLRLAVNLLVGHLLVKVICGFAYDMYLNLKGLSLVAVLFPLLFLVVFISLEILIAYLQGYIFVFITCITIKDMAINLYITLTVLAFAYFYFLEIISISFTNRNNNTSIIVFSLK